MAYEMVMPYHLHMPSYFLETFTEYPYFVQNNKWQALFALTVYMCPLFLFFSLNCEGVTPFICLNEVLK